MSLFARYEKYTQAARQRGLKPLSFADWKQENSTDADLQKEGLNR